MTAYLRFPDEATAQSVLAEYYVQSDEFTGWITASLTHALDPVGALYTAGKYDEDGTVITEPAAEPGWHVNFIGELPKAAEAYILNPKTPQVIFAA